MSEPEQPPAASPEWWNKFGAAYDETDEPPPAPDFDAAAPAPSSSSGRTPRAEELLEDQMALNARTLAQVRAKAELLEVEEASNARLRIGLSEARAAGEARACPSAGAGRDPQRWTPSGLAARREEQVAARRESSAEVAVQLQAITSEHELEAAALRKAVREATDARDAAEAQLRDATERALASEEEAQALRACLDEERGGGALERLAKLLVKQKPSGVDGRVGGGGDGGAGTGGTGGLSSTSVAGRIEKLSDWAHERVRAAEEAAEAAQAEAARATMALQAAPRPEALRAQAEQAAEARAANRTLATQLRETQRECAAMSVKLAAASERAEAAEAALSRQMRSRSPMLPGSAPEEEGDEEEGASSRGEPGGCGLQGGGHGVPGRRWARPTSASQMRRASAPSKGVAAAAKRAEAMRGRCGTADDRAERRRRRFRRRRSTARRWRGQRRGQRRRECQPERRAYPNGCATLLAASRGRCHRWLAHAHRPERRIARGRVGGIGASASHPARIPRRLECPRRRPPPQRHLYGR